MTAQEILELAIINFQDESYHANIDIIEALVESREELRRALNIAHNACGVAATLLMFHGRPSLPLDNCVANLKKNDLNGENALTKDDARFEKLVK